MGVKPSERLYATAREMESRPWHRGTYFPDRALSPSEDDIPPSTPCCVMAAAYLSSEDRQDLCDDRGLEYFRKASGGFGPVQFNDYVAKTKEDVIKVLRRAAALADIDFK